LDTVAETVGEPVSAVWETTTLPSSVPSSRSWADVPVSPAVDPLLVLVSSLGDGLAVEPPVVVPPVLPLLVGQVSEGTHANLTR
jgi:hypothetical protein